ncbi:hypothetical protein BYT27DRAFT_7298701 [Phlegmacium glaucopus]|nr:hypothetical protein BYT27DRAFT_7298701 [Phlegmacium glaucopus]
MPSNETVLACLENPKRIFFQDTTGSMKKIIKFTSTSQAWRALNDCGWLEAKHPSHTQIRGDFWINIAFHSPAKLPYPSSIAERALVRDLAMRVHWRFTYLLARYFGSFEPSTMSNVQDNYRIVVFDA